MSSKDKHMKTMTPDRVRQLIASYGGDPARWPEAEREGAARLMRADASLKAAAAEAARLDAFMDAPESPRPSAALTGRVLSDAPREKGAAIRGLFAMLWRPATGLATALAVAAILGVIAGTLSPMPLDGDDGTTDTEIASLVADISALDLEAPE